LNQIMQVAAGISHLHKMDVGHGNICPVCFSVIRWSFQCPNYLSRQIFWSRMMVELASLTQLWIFSCVSSHVETTHLHRRHGATNHRRNYVIHT
jgi:hypothetical protein